MMTAEVSANDAMVTSDDLSSETACGKCGRSALQFTEVSLAIWLDKRLAIIEAVPALVCTSCREQYFDDETATILELMRGDGLRAQDAVRQDLVPVFTFQARPGNSAGADGPGPR